jgi:hypothetical protein
MEEPPAGSAATQAANERPRPGVALLLAAAAVIAALLGARASFAASGASGAWQRSVRLEIRRAALTSGLGEQLYIGVGPHAVQAAQGRILASRLTAAAAAATGLSRSALRVEAGAVRSAASVIAGTLPDKGTRFRSGSGYYLSGFLLEDQRENARNIGVSPGASERRGDRSAARGVADVAATVPVSLAFLFGALAQGFERRRRLFLIVGWVALAAGIAVGVVIWVAA